MSEIDYALAYDFIIPTQPNVNWQLRFSLEQITTGSPWHTNPTGQLIAVVVNYGHANNGYTIAVSRPGIHFIDAEKAVNADCWPLLAPYKINLAEIRRRVVAAGLT